MIRDDFDRRLGSWLGEAAVGPTPPALLEAVLQSTRVRRSRPAWIVALRGGGMGTTVRFGGQPIRRWAYLITVAALAGALVAGLLLAAGARRTGASGAIVFLRTDVARSSDSAFIIGPQGSGEWAMPAGAARLAASTDGRHVLLGVLVADPSPIPGAPASWYRPAIANPDGSGLMILNAYPDRKMHLEPVAWSPDGTRILAGSGGEDVNPDDVGLYTVRATDGGDLQRVVSPPSGAGGSPIGYTPDGSRIVFIQWSVLAGIWVVGVDGSGLRRLTPPQLAPVDNDFWDGVSADLSPDGSSVAFAATPPGQNGSSLYVVGVDGAQPPRDLLPPGLGALSARWSPGGTTIAFTSGHQGVGRTPAGRELINDPQVWVVNADGNGLKALTTGTDGSFSITPVWSPDGSRLLFQRKLGDTVNLWTVNADGSREMQLTSSPVAADYVGEYAWTSLHAP
jgi:hypothetical protein